MYHLWKSGQFDFAVTNVTNYFFFQAEDGIRDGTVTGVQTCALPISIRRCSMIPTDGLRSNRACPAPPGFITVTVLSTSSSSALWVCPYTMISARGNRSEERRVGNGVRAGWAREAYGE